MRLAASSAAEVFDHVDEREEQGHDDDADDEGENHDHERLQHGGERRDGVVHFIFIYTSPFFNSSSICFRRFCRVAVNLARVIQPM